MIKKVFGVVVLVSFISSQVFAVEINSRLLRAPMQLGEEEGKERLLGERKESAEDTKKVETMFDLIQDLANDIEKVIAKAGLNVLIEQLDYLVREEVNGKEMLIGRLLNGENMDTKEFEDNKEILKIVKEIYSKSDRAVEDRDKKEGVTFEINAIVIKYIDLIEGINLEPTEFNGHSQESLYYDFGDKWNKGMRNFLIYGWVMQEDFSIVWGLEKLKIYLQMLKDVRNPTEVVLERANKYSEGKGEPQNLYEFLAYYYRYFICSNQDMVLKLPSIETRRGL